MPSITKLRETGAGQREKVKVDYPHLQVNPGRPVIWDCGAAFTRTTLYFPDAARVFDPPTGGFLPSGDLLQDYSASAPLTLTVKNSPPPTPGHYPYSVYCETGGRRFIAEGDSSPEIIV